jgi:methylamine dehydrogenase accessory protein MauD
VPEALLASNIILWFLVIILSLVVFALARQVGVLHERVAPAGALMPTNGPKVGELTEAGLYKDLNGDPLTLGGASDDRRATLVLWISPTCPVCKGLVPTARSVCEDENFNLVFASDGDKLEQHQAYVRDLGIVKYPYIISQALGMKFAVSKLPFAALIGPDGTLRSKGLVNTREHLESLAESMETGIDTLQDYMKLVDNPPVGQAKEHAQ